MSYSKVCNLTGEQIGVCGCTFHRNRNMNHVNLGELISYENSVGVIYPYSGIGELGSVRSTAKQVLDYANSLITPLPSPLRATIDGLPISRSQKYALKNRPISFFIVLADAARDKIIEFIKRVEPRRVTYKVGRSRVLVYPRRSDSAARLVEQMLAVSWNKPMKAARVSAMMQIEIGAKTLRAVGSGIAESARTVGRGAKKAWDATSNAANKAFDATSSAANKALDATGSAAKKAGSAIKSAFNKLNPFGEFDELGALDAGVVSGPAAATAGGAAAATATGIEFNAIVGTMTAFAPIVIPIIKDLIGGKKPTKPTVSEFKESERISEEIKISNGPNMQTIALGTVVVGGLGYLAYSALSKR